MPLFPSTCGVDRSDPLNVLLARSDRGTHDKILDAYASVLFQEDRDALAKQPVLCIGLAEDIK